MPIDMKAGAVAIDGFLASLEYKPGLRGQSARRAA